MSAARMALLATVLACAGCARGERQAGEDGDQVLLRQLREAGADLSKPTTVTFYAYFPDSASAARTSTAFGMPGYAFAVMPPDSANARWTLRFTTQLAPTLDTVRAIGRRISQAAIVERGSYDGWEAEVRR